METSISSDTGHGRLEAGEIPIFVSDRYIVCLITDWRILLRWAILRRISTYFCRKQLCESLENTERGRNFELLDKHFICAMFHPLPKDPNFRQGLLRCGQARKNSLPQFLVLVL